MTEISNRCWSAFWSPYDFLLCQFCDSSLNNVSPFLCIAMGLALSRGSKFAEYFLNEWVPSDQAFCATLLWQHYLCQCPSASSECYSAHLVGSPLPLSTEECHSTVAMISASLYLLGCVKTSSSGAPGWLSQLSICFQLRSWSWGPGIEPHIRLSAQWRVSFSLSFYPSPCSCSLSLSLALK